MDVTLLRDNAILPALEMLPPRMGAHMGQGMLIAIALRDAGDRAGLLAYDITAVVV